jgi:PKD repeat protein
MRAVRQLLYGISLVLILLGAVGCPSVPEPRVAASIRNGEAPLTVHFHDISFSRGSKITAWEWHFGDGATSTEQHPTHTYTSPGDHDVRLTVTNETGSAFRLLPDYIHVRALDLEDGDRVGLLMVTADCDGPVGTTARAVGSMAFFLPGELDQLTSLGYLGAPMNADPCLDFVEAMEPDTYQVLTFKELETWLRGEFKTISLPGIWNMEGLDAGGDGSITANSHTEALIPWEDHPDFLLDYEDHFAFLSGAFAQENLITVSTPPLSAAFTWPGGTDLGPITATVDLPEGLTFLAPFGFRATDPVGKASVMGEIGTSGPMNLSWLTPSRDPGFIQVVLMVSGGAAVGTKILLVKAVDDGSFTVPAEAMAQLPANDPAVQYDQEVFVSRLLSSDVPAALTGGGSGQLRTVGMTGCYIRYYSNHKSNIPRDLADRPILSRMKSQ